MRGTWVLILVGLMVMPFGAAARPSDAQMRNKNDADLEARLRELAPDAVPQLTAATAALRAEQWQQAADGYRRLAEQVPAFTPALRRACAAELRLGHRDEALRLCRKAATDGASDNLQALARALAVPPHSLADMQEARATAERAEALTPDDVYAQYALCEVMARQGALQTGARCLQFVREHASNEMVSSLLLLQTMTEISGDDVSTDQAQRARELMDEAVTLTPEEPQTHSVDCMLGARSSDVGRLRHCSSKLEALAPLSPQTHWFAGIGHLMNGDYDAAEAAADRGAELGLDPKMLAQLREGIDENRPFYHGWLRGAAWVLGAWLSGLVLLLLAGITLSHMALRAAKQPPNERSGRATGMSGRLRAVYRAVLACSCIYYYLSIPIVVGVVLASGAAVIGGVLATGYIAPKLFIIVGFFVLMTVIAIGKSLFVRVKDEDPGVKLDLAAYPALNELSNEVAAKVGTRPVDSVFLTPDTSIAVFERGGMLSQLRGKSERCLILGLAVLEGMSLDELRAILAHEYGHFSNRDTAGGGLSLAVRRSLMITIFGLAAGGAASNLNPAWLFMLGFHRLFLRISHGASRLQEVLADRWAAYCYGAENMVSGLTHVIRRTVEFDLHAEGTVKDLANGKRALANLYTYAPAAGASAETIEEAFTEALERAASPYDSHPAPRERFELVRALGAAPAPAGERKDAWSLFPEREKLEREMTLAFCDRVFEATGAHIRYTDSPES